MAITDNNFTGAELAAAIQTNPALAAELKTFGETAGFHIRTKDEETSFLQNYETTVAGRKTSEIANAIEKDIKEAYGVDKNENEKYHDYLKRVATEHKTKLGSLQTELAELKKGKPDSDDKIRITQLEQAITAEKEKLGNELKEKDNTIHKLKSSFEIEKALGTIRSKYKLGIPDEVIKTFEDNVSNALIASMKEIDGVFVVLDKNGVPEIDNTTYKPKTVEQAMRERLASIVDEGRKAAGAGTGKENEDNNSQTIDGVVKDASGAITSVASIPAEIKTKVALTEWLLKIGLPVDHPVHIEAYGKFGNSLVLR